MDKTYLNVHGSLCLYSYIHGSPYVGPTFVEVHVSVDVGEGEEVLATEGAPVDCAPVGEGGRGTDLLTVDGRVHNRQPATHCNVQLHVIKGSSQFFQFIIFERF
jgi:hypothetical protein